MPRLKLTVARSLFEPNGLSFLASAVEWWASKFRRRFGVARHWVLKPIELLLDGGEVAAVHRDVLVLDALFVVHRGRHRALGEDARLDVGVMVEPGRQLVVLGLDLVLRIGVVQRRGQVLVRTELQGQLAVGPLALRAAHEVGDVLRGQVDVVGTRRIGDVGITRRARLRNGAAAGIAHLERAEPAVGHGGLVHAQVAFLVAAADREAEHAVAEDRAVDARDFRRPRALGLVRARQVVVRGVVHALDADAGGLAQVERTRGHDVDGGADAARRRVGARALVDLDLRHRFRGQVAEVEGAAGLVAQAGGRHLAAVQQDHVEVRTDAAHGHVGAFAAVAVDRHARDALQRFRQVGIRELADVVGDDTVDDTVGIALQVQGRLQAGADAGDFHDIGGRRRRRARACRWDGCHTLRAAALVLCKGRDGQRGAGAGDGQADQAMPGVRIKGCPLLDDRHGVSSLVSECGGGA